MPRLIPAAVLLSLIACAGDSSSGGSSDAATTGDTAAGLKSWGNPCQADDQCATGRCLSNDYAPFGWCSAECATDEAPCEGDTGGWCTRLPDDFMGQEKTICLPLCNDKFECQAKSELWEACKEPSWKGNPLHPTATGIRVCQSPSQHGKQPIDTGSCQDWEPAYQDEFATQISVCKAYCDYLKICGEVADPAAFSADCCALGCMLKMTPEGVLDTVYDKEKKCFVTSFSANQGTANVCTAPPSDCNAQPEDPTPDV